MGSPAAPSAVSLLNSWAEASDKWERSTVSTTGFTARFYSRCGGGVQRLKAAVSLIVRAGVRMEVAVLDWANSFENFGVSRR